MAPRCTGMREWNLLWCLLIICVARNGVCEADGHCQRGSLNCSAPVSNRYNKDKVDLLVLTVATEATEGYLRFVASAEREKISVKTLGMNEAWKGGNVLTSPGGGHKVNLLKKAMHEYKDNKDLIVMFVDSYDVIFTGGKNEILKKFFSFDANAVFSAEGFCWPDENLAKKYPESGTGKRFLNSGGFMGYAPEVYRIVTTNEIKDEDDDQLFYTKIYLDQEVRDKLRIKLDNRAAIFQNLNGAIGEVELTNDVFPAIKNTAYGTKPLVLHGNGPSKITLNSLSNYLAGAWKTGEGCLVCGDVKELDEANLPKVFVGIYIEQPTPFMQEFFDKFVALDYPKNKITLFIHRATNYHDEIVTNFLQNQRKEYSSVILMNQDDALEWKARNMALEECLRVDCDFYLNLDTRVHIENPSVIRHLIKKDRGVVAPLMTRYQNAWSNYWGSLTPEGFYARSHDYMDIVAGQKKGIWNVPFLSEIYLIKKEVLLSKKTLSFYASGSLDPDMAFCKNLRDIGVFMYVDNTDYFGFLINSDGFDITKKHPDLYEIYSNQKAWQQRYIHEDYLEALKPETEVTQVCPDVYWFPIASPAFCQHLIDIMENFGKWSDGTSSDPRLAGGYENVPTRDIHMKQVFFEPQWLFFLREYVRPMQEKVFTGYFHDPPKAIMNFVVRYRPDEQPSLKPHHDASTYTINLSLNQVDKDFTGGGSRFIRYNCSVTSSPAGWAILHPGRLTHYHEGLTTLSGTRYIMVSFVDP